MSKQRHKCTNTGNKIIAHHNFRMPVGQRSGTKLILYSDYTKIFFEFIGNFFPNKPGPDEYAAVATVTLAEMKLCNFVA